MSSGQGDSAPADAAEQVAEESAKQNLFPPVPVGTKTAFGPDDVAVDTNAFTPSDAAHENDPSVDQPFPNTDIGETG